MGPLQNHLAGVKPNPQADGLGYNPRCLSRDISKQAAAETTDEKVAFLINNSTDIKSFQDLMQNFVPGSVGIHSGGHYTIGGDAGSDLYNSPADPAFFLHHVNLFPLHMIYMQAKSFRVWLIASGGHGRIWTSRREHTLLQAPSPS